jgi:hypothetical protein
MTSDAAMASHDRYRDRDWHERAELVEQRIPKLRKGGSTSPAFWRRTGVVEVDHIWPHRLRRGWPAARVR